MINRRKFFKSTLVASLGTGLSLNSYGNEEGKDKQKKYLSVIECDIAVVGAGPAGIPAAVAAARNGAKVVLLDEDAMIGGAPVDMYVTMLCGAPHLGIFKEIITTLREKYDLRSDKKKYGGEWWQPAAFATVLSQLVAKEKNLRVITNAFVNGVVMENSTIKGVEFTSYNNKKLVKAKLIIDSTGTGLLSELAGAKYMYGREAKSDFGERYALDKRDDKVMPCTWMAIIQRHLGNKNLKLYQGKMTIDSGLGNISADDLSKNRADANTYLQWMHTASCDTRDPHSLGALQELILKKHMPKILDEFHEQGFSVQLAPKIGVRECRRVIGHKIITSEDILKKEYPEDVIAQGEYSLDSWGRHDMQELLKVKCNFGIPYKACVVKGVDNLLMAGKHISATSLAESALRVQPILAGIGQGVGTAAAMIIKNKTKALDIDIKSLQKTLAKDGTLPKQYA